MKPILCFLLLPLAACGGIPTVPPPVPEVRTVTVKVPVPTPCVSVVDIPKVPGSSFKPGADMKQNAAAADLDLRAFEDYAVTADALLRQCAK